jgi:hypothetical protein
VATKNEQHTTLGTVVRGKTVHSENKDLTILLEQKLSGENITEYKTVQIFLRAIGKNKRRSFRRQLPRCNILHISFGERVNTLTITNQSEYNICVSGCLYWRVVGWLSELLLSGYTLTDVCVGGWKSG